METSLTRKLNALGDSQSHFIRIPQGPQFKARGSALLATFFLMSIITSFALIKENEYILSLLSGILGILALNLALDLRGIELDKRTHSIRDYKSFLWFRFGKWSDLREFKTLSLTQKNVTVGNSEDAEYSSDTYHYYHLKLVSEVDKREIFLAEYRNYYKALEIAKGIAGKTGLELKDFIKRPKRKFNESDTPG